MFKPARMSRLLVSGHNSQIEEVIEALHGAGAIHIEDYADPTGITRIGDPLPAGDKTSELLVRVRGLQKSLEAEGASPKQVPTSDPEKLLVEAEQASSKTLERQIALRSEVASLEAEVAALAPFSDFDLDLSFFTSLTTVRGFLGVAREAPDTAGIGEADVRAFAGGVAVAWFVPVAKAKEAEGRLAAAGFQASPIPGASGTPKAVVADLEHRLASATASLTAVEAEVAALRVTWGPRLAALERFLDAEVDKTQAPLQFGVTESTFHLEGWVPKKQVAAVEGRLAAKFGPTLLLERLGDAPREHAADHHEKGEHRADHDAGHAEHHDSRPEDEPPIHLEHKGLAKPFVFLLTLMGRPRYREIDPTVLMMVFFPLFFGFMVGDLAVGILVVIVGLLLKKHKVFGIGGPAVSRVLVISGVLAAAFGLIVFGEALGIHFVADDAFVEEDELTWEVLIHGKEAVLAGHGFPTEGFLHKVGGAGHDAHAADADHGGEAALTTHAAEAHEETSLVSMKPHGTTYLDLSGLRLGYYSKIHDITALLVLSLVAGVIHLVLGFALGVRNINKAHGFKLAMQERGSWLMIMAAIPVAVWGLMGGPSWALPAGGALFVFAVALLYLGVKHTVGVGFIAFLEIPSLAGNLLSYTRLAAIGASKAGMAIAFSAVGLLLSGGSTGVVWWIVYIIGMLAITGLAILSGGLQSLRLQFVEFFSKFYEGGGRPYLPFGRRAP